MNDTNLKPELVLAPLAAIDVGERHRKDMGDLDGLAASINDIGLLHPVPVLRDGDRFRLLAGERRLKAHALMGRETIPAYVVKGSSEALALLRAERDENRCRKDVLPSEAVALGKKVEALEREEAKRRQEASRAGKGTKVGDQGGGNLPPPSSGNGKTRDRVAEAIGMSGKTYEKAKKVVEAAEADPTLKPVVEEMDRTGKVDPAFRKVQPGKAKDAKAVPSSGRTPGQPAWSDREKKLRHDLESGRTVVVNVRLATALVPWARAQNLLVRVDDGTEWACPFVVGEDGNRTEVNYKYARYLQDKPGLLAKAATLKGKALGCHCVPEVCHGYVVRDLAHGETLCASDVTTLQARLQEVTAKVNELMVSLNKEAKGFFPSKEVITTCTAKANYLLSALCSGRDLSRSFTIVSESVSIEDLLGRPDGQAVIEKWYREVAKKYHPDRGGMHEVMVAINDVHVSLLEAMLKRREKVKG
jgi:hypothetical protein